jgi:hypothetical protein
MGMRVVPMTPNYLKKDCKSYLKGEKHGKNGAKEGLNEDTEGIKKKPIKAKSVLFISAEEIKEKLGKGIIKKRGRPAGSKNKKKRITDKDKSD